MRGFASFHPVTLMVYFTAVLLITMFFNIPILLLLSLCGGAVMQINLNKRYTLRTLLFDVGLFLVVALANPLFSHKGMTILFFLNGNPITYEAVRYGINMSLMLLAVLKWGQVYMEIMTSEKQLFLFGKVLPNLSVVLSMALRFIPLLRLQTEKVSNAQTAMGLYAKDNYSDKIRGRMRVFSIVLTWSLENAMDTSNSMRARGYGIGKRTYFHKYSFRLRDILMCSFTLLVFGITIWAKAIGRMEYVFFPEIIKIPVTAISLAVYISYGLLVLLPFILEGKEMLKWKCYRSKI